MLACALFYYVFQSSVGQLTIITSDVPRPRSDWRVKMRARRRGGERSDAERSRIGGGDRRVEEKITEGRGLRNERVAECR